MKPLFPVLLAAFSTFGGYAQTPATPVATLSERSEMLASQTYYNGALDQLRFIGADDTECRAFAKATYLFGAGRYTEARTAFARFRADYPYSICRDAAAKGVADCYLAEGDYARSLMAYEDAERSGLPRAEAAELSLRAGICAMRTGAVNKARECFAEAAQDRSTASAANFYRGVLAYDAADFKSARNYFRLTDTGRAPGDMSEFYLVSIDFAEKNYSKALSAVKQMQRRNAVPAEYAAELNRIAGESAWQLGEREEAVQYLGKYVAATKEPAPTALYVLGIDAFGNGDYDKAYQYLAPVAAEGTGAIRQSAYLFMGQCLFEQGDTSAAILAFDKAAKSDDDPAVREAAFYNYASAKFAGASVPFASSAEVFERFLKLYPSGPYSDRVAAYLASGYIADNDYNRALERLDAIENPSDKLLATKQRVLYTLGVNALGDNKLDKAADYLAKARALAAHDRAIAAETSLAEGQLLYKQGKHVQAADKYRAYLNTASRDSENRAVALYGLGYALYRAGQPQGAAKYFNEAVGVLGSAQAKADALNRLGDIASAHGDFDEAADYYARAFSQSPSTGDYALLNGARVKGYKRDYKGKLESLDLFRRSFGSSVLMPDALLETTQAQISLGRNEDAVSTYRILIDQYPRTAQGRRGYLQMAMTLLDMERKPEAVEAYKKVISLYPTSEEAAQASALLKNIYAEQGEADEYIAFINSVEQAPQIDADEVEELTFRSALAEFEKNGVTRQLEAFAANYPSSPNAPLALGKVLAKATSKGDKATLARLATAILERYPDSAAAEPALLAQADESYSTGNFPEAFDRYKALADKASEAALATQARLGLMRTARDMGRFDDAEAAADAILASSAGTSELTEAKFTKAVALSNSGKADSAVEIWLDLADDSADIFGARSAYEAAAALADSGKNKRALDVAQKFVKSGSPQRYWVARSFILISDILEAQGKKFESKEYLEALRDNYPGTEPDIFMMIETRLSDEK